MRNGDASVDVSEYSSSPMAVARRLSNHSQKHKASMTGYDGQREESNNYKKKNLEDVSQMHHIPLVEFHNVPELRNTLGDDVPSYLLLTSKDLRNNESLKEARSIGSNENIRLEVSVGILHDSTVAIEVALSSAMIQWPYFHDSSLVCAYVFETMYEFKFVLYLDDLLIHSSRFQAWPMFSIPEPRRIDNLEITHKSQRNKRMK